jgi:hypothetical protein
MGRDSLNSWLRSVAEAKRHQAHFYASLTRIKRLLQPRQPQGTATTTTQRISPQQEDHNPISTTVNEKQTPCIGRTNKPISNNITIHASTSAPISEKLKLHEIDHE